MKNKVLIILLIIITLLLAGCSTSKIGSLGSAHEHADFKVYINGEELNFSQLMYMVRSQYVHVENMDGNIIHNHATGITIGYFFNTMGIRFDDNCFVLDTGTSYCNQGDKTLKFYVNGERNYQYAEYEIRNSDKYLITYGNDSEEEIQKQLDSVTDHARTLGGWFTKE